MGNYQKVVVVCIKNALTAFLGREGKKGWLAALQGQAGKKEDDTQKQKKAKSGDDQIASTKVQCLAKGSGPARARGEVLVQKDKPQGWVEFWK